MKAWECYRDLICAEGQNLLLFIRLHLPLEISFSSWIRSFFFWETAEDIPDSCGILQLLGQWADGGMVLQRHRPSKIFPKLKKLHYIKCLG